MKYYSLFHIKIVEKLNYRKIVNELDIQAIQEYAYVLPKTNMELETFQMEVL